MDTEYQLSYTAAEINRKLATVDENKVALKNKADLIDGKIPVEQIPDYITEANKTELVNAVIAALPTAEGASF